MVSTLAGSGTVTWADGVGSAARFFFPSGVAVDSTGAVFVGDTNNGRVRIITSAGEGCSSSVCIGAAFLIIGCSAVLQNEIYFVCGLFIYYVGCGFCHVGVVSTFAGSGSFEWADGVGTSARLAPDGVSVDSRGTICIVEGFKRIRMITSAGEELPGMCWLRFNFT